MSSSKPALETIISAGDTLKNTALDENYSDAVEEWIALHGLERLDDPETIVARQAAFNLALKATLYDQYKETHSLPDIDAGNGREALSQAEDRTGDPAFQEYVLDDVVWSAPTETIQALLSTNSFFAEAPDPAEKIGKTFEDITPQESRRKLGQFRTPTAVADLMASWVIDDANNTVLDPGMGAGALSAAAYRQKLSYDTDASLKDIQGIDLNELALVMSATSLRLLNNDTPHNLSIGDFLDKEATEEVDSVISNPPYTRHHELDEEMKQAVNTQAEAETDSPVSSLSPLYAYFYIHASQFLKPGGKMTFITPAEFLETNYGESLKRFLLDEFDIRALVMTDRDVSLFEEAMTTTCISFLERDTTDTDTPTKFIKVDEWVNEDTIRSAIEDDSVSGKTDWGYVNTLPQDGLESSEKWTLLFDTIEISDIPELKPLSKIGDVDRGIATGKNDYFCLSQGEVDEHGIEERYLSPLIRSSSRAEHYDYTTEDWEKQRAENDEVWLLYHLDVWKPQLNDTNVREYLDYGKEIGADDSYLAKNRTPWYLIDRRDPPDIFFTYMSRDGGRATYNRAQARNLNNLHGLYLQDEYDESDTKALLTYLNSEIGDQIVKRGGRTYMGGLSKVEPSELEDAPVLDPHEMDREEVNALAELFDELCAASRGDGDEQEVNERIRNCLTTILDLDEPLIG